MSASVAVGVGESLRELLGPDGVRTGDAAAAYRIANVAPAAAVLPRDDADVSRALSLAFRNGWSVVPWGGGAHQSLGRPPRGYDVALDLRRLDRILAYEPADMTVTVQAGIRLSDLECRVAEFGQFWPLDPPLADQATVGGIVAAGLAGPLRCRYGGVRDLVLGVRIAHADGTITKAGSRVVKNATAYDLTKLYAGSYGTLGVLLEATLRLQPRPAVERAWILSGATIGHCQEAAGRIVASHLAPSRVELLDGVCATACGLVPAMDTLVVTFGGVSEAVRDQGQRVQSLAKECDLRATQVENPAHMCRALRDFPWRGQGSASAAVTVLWRGSVRSSDTGMAMRTVRDAVADSESVAMAGTASHGALRGTLGAATVDRASHALTKARDAFEAMGGFLVVLEAPPAIHARVDAWGSWPAELSWMEQIRSSFDPQALLNPGRFIDARAGGSGGGRHSREISPS